MSDSNGVTSRAFFKVKHLVAAEDWLFKLPTPSPFEGYGPIVEALRSIHNYVVEHEGELGPETILRMDFLVTGREAITWDETLRKANEWFDRVIPHTAESDVLKFKEESEEFLTEPSVEEAADALLCLTHWAHLKGLDLLAAVKAKMEKNAARKWEQRLDGTWKHIK